MNSNKGFGLVGLLITVLLIALLSGGALYGYKGGLFTGGTASSTITGPIDAAKNAKDLLEKNNQEINNEVGVTDQSTPLNQEYVKLTNVTANKDTFVFAAPIKKSDISEANIKYCVTSTSAGAEFDGRKPECTETTPANSFSLQYNESTKTLIVSNSTPVDPFHGGTFSIDCASCALTIEYA